MNPDVVNSLLHGFSLIYPEMLLGLAACVLFVGGAFREGRNLWAGASLAALAAAAAALAWSPVAEASSSPIYPGPLYVDRLAVLVKWLALAGGAVLVLMTWYEPPVRFAAEYFGCFLLMVAGLGLVGAANELVTMFVALELISIPTYIVLYLPKSDEAGQEASMKYFLLSVFSSALLLFGFSYLYGLTGTTNISGILEALPQDEPGRLPLLALLSLVMVVGGLGFRITAVPFHFYAPDVYQGAPTGIAALLAFIPKVAGFVALVRVLGFVNLGVPEGGLALGGQVPILLWILAAVTMTLGNVLALLQDNLKRLLAYSSVAHAGYMLIGLAVAQPLVLSASGPARGGVEAVLFYLVAYGAMTIGAFAVISYLSTPVRPVESEDDITGLGQSHPGVALLMAIFLFSLIGIPFTAGFWGKFLLFMGAMTVEGDNGPLFRWLALIGALNAAIGGWYYLRILAKMYLYPTARPLEQVPAGPGRAALWVCAAVTLVLGVQPDLFLKPAHQAVGTGANTPAAQASNQGTP